MGRNKTHDEYIEELKIKNPAVEVAEKYIDAKTKIKHHCLIHDIYWEISPSNVLKGIGCKECQKDKIRKKNSKTHEQYVNELKTKNPNINVLENYSGANNPILHKCLIDGYVWMASPANILYGKGCPRCAGNIKRTHQEYVDRLKHINPNIVLMEEYTGSHSKLLFKCLLDGNEWKADANSVLRGCGCPKCAPSKLGKKLRLPKKDIIKRIESRGGKILNVDEYIEYFTENLIIVCPSCGNEFITSLAKFNKDKGNLCPNCHTRESLGERSIRTFLENHDIRFEQEYIFNGCKDINPLPFDFYLLDYNICIEYDGQQHFKPVDFAGNGEAWANEQFKINQKHDQIKNDYCKNNNIKLLRIAYWNNVEEELNNFLFN